MAHAKYAKGIFLKRPGDRSVRSTPIGAGGAFVPNAFQSDGFGFFRNATAVLINLFGEEIDGRRPNLFRLLIGPAQFPFFGGPVQMDEGDIVRHAESVLPHPSEDRAVIGEDGVGLLLLHPGNDARFVELIDKEGFDFS